MTSDYELGPDADIDVEDVWDRQGRRVTAEYAEQAAAEVLALVRPGLSALGTVGQHSPQVSFRVPEQVRRRAEERAAAEGRSVRSSRERRWLERYLRDAS